MSSCLLARKRSLSGFLMKRRRVFAEKLYLDRLRRADGRDDLDIDLFLVAPLDHDGRAGLERAAGDVAAALELVSEPNRSIETAKWKFK